MTHYLLYDSFDYDVKKGKNIKISFNKIGKYDVLWWVSYELSITILTYRLILVTVTLLLTRTIILMEGRMCDMYQLTSHISLIRTSIRSPEEANYYINYGY